MPENHPSTAAVPARRVRLLPGPARQRADHHPAPPAVGRPGAAGRQRQHVPARKDHPMNRPAFLSLPARRLALAAPAAVPANCTQSGSAGGAVCGS